MCCKGHSRESRVARGGVATKPQTAIRRGKKKWRSTRGRMRRSACNIYDRYTILYDWADHHHQYWVSFIGLKLQQPRYLAILRLLTGLSPPPLSMSGRWWWCWWKVRTRPKPEFRSDLSWFFAVSFYKPSVTSFCSFNWYLIVLFLPGPSPGWIASLIQMKCPDSGCRSACS